VSRIAFIAPGKPVSTNATYLRGNGRRLYKSDAAVVFATQLQMAARRAMRGAPPLTGSLEVGVTMVFDSERPDIDGPIKPVLDAMQRIVFANDRQVRRLTVERVVDRERPRVEVVVTEVTP
jgi:Holliday junction resolvase RusA-like endonuclease